MAAAGYTVPTIEALKKVGPGSRVDGMILWVLEGSAGGGVAYIYRSGSTQLANDDEIILPEDGIGRWILNSGQRLSSMLDVDVAQAVAGDILRFQNGRWQSLRPQPASDQQYGTVRLGPGMQLNAASRLCSAMTVKNVTDATYVVTDNDTGCLLITPSELTIVIPTDDYYPSILGTQIALMSARNRGITLDPDPGVTIRSQELITTSGPAYSLMFLLKIGANEWLAGGETA